MDTAGLLFRIRSDSSDAQADLAKLEAQVASTTASTDSAFAGLAGSATIAAGVILGVAAAAVVVTSKLFDLAKGASDTGSQIHDLAEQTGFSTEAISSLKVAADQSGTSIEGVSKGIKFFTGLLADAAKGSRDAQATLKNLRVTSTDLETAFAQVVKRVSELPPGLEQNAAAADAFGKRLGAELIPLINQFHGDLPGLIAECKRLGLTWSKEDAAAADDFGDQSVLLNKQLQALKTTIGKDLMPVFLKWSKELSSWLVQNKGEIDSWSKSFADGIDEIVQKFKSDKSDLDALLRFLQDIGDVLNPNVSNEQLKQNRANRSYADRISKLPAATPPSAYDYSRPGQPGTPEGYTQEEARRKEAEERKKEEEKEAKERKAEQERLFQQRIQSLSEYYRNLLENTKIAYDEQQKELEAAYKRGEISEAQYRETARRSIGAYFDYVKGTIDKQEKLEITSAKNSIDQENAHLAAVRASATLKITLKENATDVDKTIAAQKAKFDAEEKKRPQEEEKDLNQLISTWKEEGKAIADNITKVNELAAAEKERNEEQGRQTLEAIANPLLAQGPDTTQGPFDGWTQSWTAFFSTIQADAPVLGQILESVAGILENAFQGFANAIGSVTQQWVLTGQTGPAVMRKILASALATIAAEAAVRAIFELAAGFASLFFNPAEAAAHFTAAALYGSIAVVSGLAGRAIAGDAFKQQTGQATGAAGSSASRDTSGQGAQYSSYGTKAAVDERSRNAPEQRVRIDVHVESNDSHIIKVVKKDVANNGALRTVIQNA